VSGQEGKKAHYGKQMRGVASSTPYFTPQKTLRIGDHGQPVVIFAATDFSPELVYSPNPVIPPATTG